MWSGRHSRTSLGMSCCFKTRNHFGMRKVAVMCSILTAVSLVLLSKISNWSPVMILISCWFNLDGPDQIPLLLTSESRLVLNFPLLLHCLVLILNWLVNKMENSKFYFHVCMYVCIQCFYFTLPKDISFISCIDFGIAHVVVLTYCWRRLWACCIPCRPYQKLQ